MKNVRIAALVAATLAASALTACGSDTNDAASTSAVVVEATTATTTADNSSSATTATASQSQDTPAEDNGGGPGGFGKNFDASTVTTVDELNALINEAYGQASLGLHRGHQPVEQVLIDTLGISHDEMHVRMDAGQNLSAIAEDQGVGTQTLIDTLVENWQPAIDNLESEGLIDADQAAQYHEALVDAFTFKVTWNGTDEAPTFTGV